MSSELNFELLTKKVAVILWNNFLGSAFEGKSPCFSVDEDGNLTVPFLHFPIGTPRTDVYDWFQKTFNLSTHELTYPTMYDALDKIYSETQLIWIVNRLWTKYPTLDTGALEEIIELWKKDRGYVSI